MISFTALYMCQVLHVVDFFGSRRMETAPTSIEVLLRPTQRQTDEPSDSRGSLSPTSVYSTWQSQAVTHPIMNRARRCLTSVIEHKPLSERRIPSLKMLTTVCILDTSSHMQYSRFFSSKCIACYSGVK